MSEKTRKFLIIYFSIAIIVGIIALITDFINKSNQYENITLYKKGYYGSNTFCEFYKENNKYYFSIDDDYSHTVKTKEITPIIFYLISYKTALMNIEEIDGYEEFSKNYTATIYGIILRRTDGKKINAKVKGASFPLGKNVKAFEETVAHSAVGDWDIFIFSEIENRIKNICNSYVAFRIRKLFNPIIY